MTWPYDTYGYRCPPQPIPIPQRVSVGAPFEAWLDNAPAALGTALTARIEDASGTVVATGEGIVEIAAGRYRVMLTLPTAGTYVVRWSANGTDYIGTITATDITPSVLDVSNLLYDRVTREGGAPIAEFDDTTIPTAAQVRALIAYAVADMLGRIGTAVPPQLVAEGRYLAAVYTANLIETSFAPEQTADSANYTAMNTIFNTRFPDFATRCRVPNRVPVV